MEIEISELELNEIEEILPDLATWLAGHAVCFNASAIILSAITNALDDLREQLAETEAKDE